MTGELLDEDKFILPCVEKPNSSEGTPRVFLFNNGFKKFSEKWKVIMYNQDDIVRI